MGLHEEECVVKDDALNVIVERFANTKGVRDLEQAAEHLAANALYQIEVDKVEKDDKEYYYIAEVNEEGNDIKDNYKIVCATYKDGDIFLDEVLGEDKLKSILPLFVKE